MRRLLRLALPLGLVAALALPAAANAQTTISNGITRVTGLPGTTGVTNSDFAFWGNRMYAGNYNGFRVFDISNPAAPALLANVICTAAPTGTAGQGDVSVWQNLLFRSVDTPQTRPDCARTATAGGAAGWEGVDIFDVSNPAAPRYIGGVATDCGSHTHTLVPDPANNRVFLYVSSYPSSGLGVSPFGNQCVRPHNKISVIEVPLANPATARVARTVAMNMPESAIFGGTGLAAGCHDISAFLELRIAAGACLSQGVIFDISNPGNPTVAQRLANPDIDTCARAAPSPPASPLCLWHSATFTWDGKYIVFGDEAGGGGSAECSSEDPPGRGAFWMHRVSSPTSPISRFKIPRVQPAPTQNCTAHLMNFIPTNVGYILPSSWYSGGTSVINWTNPVGTPSEFAWYEVEPPETAATMRTNTWATYWYNGYLYTQDNGALETGNRGVEILTLDQPWTRTRTWDLTRYNPQTQEHVLACTGSAEAGRLQARRRAQVHVRLRIERTASVAANQAVVNARVYARGAGVRTSARTNVSGMAMLHFTPRRAGTLRIVVRDAPNMLGCEARFRVRAAPRRAVRGGGGGAGLTGRAIFH